MEIDEIFERVRDISISRVISTRMELIKQGNYHKGLCPFHNDNTIGSFVVTEEKSLWKCFACGAGGDAAKFIAMTDKTNYIEASLKLARDFGIIEDDEYKKRSRKKYTKEYIYAVEKKNQPETKRAEIASPEILDDIYRTFIETAENYYKGGSKYSGRLSIEHMEHLINERNLTETEIHDGDFFTFPPRFISRKFTKKIQEKYDIDILSKIPGFYKEQGKDFYTFSKNKGIGIGVKNAQGFITGIQIRHDEKEEGRSRYVWFSSSFALYDERYEGGCSPGSPIDVVYPQGKVKLKYIFITEGRFKAVKIAQEYSAIAVSVQGIGTWRGIADELKKIPQSDIMANKNQKNYEVEGVFIAFDADMQYKMQVFQQARKLADSLIQNGYLPNYITWDAEKGKGIDDLINNGYKSLIKRYEKLEWDRCYDSMVDIIIEEEKLSSTIEITEEMLKRYFPICMDMEPLQPSDKK